MTTALSAAIARLERTVRFATPEEIAEHDAAIARAEEESRRGRRREHLERARPPITADDYERIVDGTCEATPFVTAVDESLAGVRREPWLVFIGTNGVGKTVAAAHGIARRGGTWVDARDLVRVYESYSQESRRRQIETAAVLLLDELGREQDPERFVPRLEQLIDARKGPRMLTVVTANLAPKDFKARYEGEERLWSRLHQVARTVQSAGRDLRRSQ